MDFFEKTVSSECIYKGSIIEVCRDKAKLINGKISEREVVQHSGGVAVVPLLDDGSVLLVRQFRYPMGTELLELPAGKLEQGEEPLECAVRELSEETGCSAGNFVNLGAIFPSPGYCRETLYCYLATNITQGRAHLDEDEFLAVERYKLGELIDMIMKNELPDAKTVIGLMKTKEYLSRS